MRSLLYLCVLACSSIVIVGLGSLDVGYQPKVVKGCINTEVSEGIKREEYVRVLSGKSYN
eukprot:2966492-Rhodomonas_salina.1